MKKKLFIFLFLILFLPIVVQAKILGLKKLTILNGELSIPFDLLNNEYTVSLSRDTYYLEIDYIVDEEVSVTINDNHDLMNNSVVTIAVNDGANEVFYHLHILKEEEEITEATFLEENKGLENEFMYKYKIYIIPSVCVLLILRVRKFLFRRHKKRII